MPVTSLDTSVVLLCACLAAGVWRYRETFRLPPGPPASLLGNAHHIPRTLPWVAFKKLADEYGPLICLWMFRSKTFVLNDYQTATALLDQRSSIYSSRPTFWMSGHLAGRSEVVFLTKTTSPRFKIYRTLLHKTLNPRAIQTYKALQTSECQTLLRGLLETPEKFVIHLRRNAIAVIMNVAYGYEVKSVDDQFVNILEESFKLAVRFVPEWFPGAAFKRLAKDVSREIIRYENIPYDWAKAQVSTGSYNESFVSDHLHDQGFATTQGERESILKWSAAALYAGGGDTTVSVMTTFFFLMVRHPDVQERARAEIDSVLGGNMATQDDMSSLPYVGAMIKEILRWGPVAPLGIPHAVTQDDEFDGYFIPKDSKVIANIWAMAQDENVYPRPRNFDPTRFLGEHPQLDPLKFIFGFGRRICPGMDLAETSLFLNMTNILSNFTISKKCGDDGREIEPEEKWSTGATSISNLPPGPPATLVGNAHHIPRTENWVALKKFADQYGPIVCIWMFNTETYFLNDYATANALLDHRSNIYSSRPPIWMSGELAGRTDNVFLTKTTSPRFRIYRTLLQKTLNPRAISTYREFQIAECQTLLRCLLETPNDFIAHLRRNAVALAMRVAYGYQVTSDDDKFVNILEESLRLGGSLNIPGKYWVEFLPVLRFIPEWFPGAGFKKLARTVAQDLRQLENVPFNWAKSQVSTGSFKESFISDHIINQDFAPTVEEREDILRWCAEALYVGGGDTTVSIITTFFFLMARHPDVQERARREIDTVLGGNMATHDDQLSLPYVNAMIKEIMRWGPVIPLGIPHQNTHDDHFDGYFIPKDTRFVPNIWAMAYDESVYPSPSTFDPTRFLGDSPQMDPMRFVFGFGRRICPGKDDLGLQLRDVLIRG
ncbi:hypothetical protein NP233_g9970 [Leucocoprinus birnbaumii]|uniref:Cytochrome P450 n=1 Tax=Leucocoprinus birnbaumii TaxID=56174 RepID=A0AAD5YSC6_9AGAR|nr:hypothetical protein NP233_g9970 [Leucocoprinus birnbaumii]